MKVARHAKAQTRRSKDALLAHAIMAQALIKAAKGAQAEGARRALLAEIDARPHYYRLLPDRSVEPIAGPLRQATLEWAREFETMDRKMADTTIDGWRVSTVFLGMDHQYCCGGPPLIFESMVFTAATSRHSIGGCEREFHESVDERRYSTYEQAMAGHAELVAETRAFVAGLNNMTWAATRDD